MNANTSSQLGLAGKRAERAIIVSAHPFANNAKEWGNQREKEAAGTNPYNATDARFAVTTVTIWRSMFRNGKGAQKGRSAREQP
jgi:hypothetical protein